MKDGETTPPPFGKEQKYREAEGGAQGHKKYAAELWSKFRVAGYLYPNKIWEDATEVAHAW